MKGASNALYDSQAAVGRGPSGIAGHPGNYRPKQGGQSSSDSLKDHKPTQEPSFGATHGSVQILRRSTICLSKYCGGLWRNARRHA